MKIAVDIGHNTEFDGGAVGILNEDKCNLEVGTLLIAKLRNAGHTVIDVLPKGKVTSTRDSLKKRTDKANAEKVDLYCCIHFNAGGGKGTEIYYKTDKGKQLGEPVLKELLKMLGSENRKMKFSDGLFVLRYTNMPAFLIECLFVDSAIDAKLYNPEKIAEAIFRGITGKGSIEPAKAVEKADVPNQKIKDLQMSCNVMGFTDPAGNKLDVDGFLGANTKSAVQKLDDYLHKNILK